MNKYWQLNVQIFVVAHSSNVHLETYSSELPAFKGLARMLHLVRVNSTHVISKILEKCNNKPVWSRQDEVL